MEIKKEKTIELFDYNSITKEQKKTVQEVIDLAKNAGHNLFAEFLKNKFQIVERKKINIDNSVFVKYAKINNLFCSVQGYVDNLNLKEPLEPIISVTDPISKFDKLVVSVIESQNKKEIK
jgi:hypothetical protein